MDMVRSFKFLVIAAGLSLLPAGAYADPAGKRIGSDLIIEVVKSVDAGELWHLSVPKTYFAEQGAPPGGVISVWNYDSESGLRDGKWVALSLIMDGIGDTAEKPVAIRVWAGAIRKVTIQERKPASGEAAAFRVSAGSRSFVLSHTPDGVVRIDGNEIGKIE